MEELVITVNFSVDGYSKLDILDDKLVECRDSTVIIALDESTSNSLYDYYNTVRNLLIHKNRVIVVVIGEESKIRKQICMLAASYRNYDIYSVLDKGSLNSEYIETLLEREPTIEEVETFIGADITAYSEMNDILLKLCEKVTVSDIDNLAELILQNKEMIQCFPSLIDYMKKTIDNYNTGLDSKVAELKTRLSDVENNMSKMKLEVAGKEQELKEALAEIEGLRKESVAATQRCIDLEQKLNNSGPSIKTYSTVNTSLIKCKVKSILYFKEVSSVRYINTFIVKLLEILDKIDKLKVKLVIYDNNSPYNCIYKPIAVINTSDYLANKDTVVNKYDKLVVVEPNRVILEDILNADYDCVIVYDKLRQTEDLVTGNCVFKYWVISSMYQIQKIESITKIDKSKIITNVGACIDAISISEIESFKTMTPSAKTSQYIQMQNVGNIKGKVMHIIKEKSNLQAIIDAKKKSR